MTKNNKKKHTAKKVHDKREKADPRRNTHQLELVAEAKLETLLPDAKLQRLEASGIHYLDGFFYIVLDNRPDIVRIDSDLHAASATARLIKINSDGTGYEDITYQPDERRWYCMIEGDETSSDQIKPRVDAFTEAFEFIESFWLDFPLQSDNKGIEGLSLIRYQDEDFMLGLCEGNACASGAKGRRPGKGRIQLFRRAPDEWTHAGTIKLPESVQFVDYSSLDLRNGYVTVLSQETSAAWVGRVRQKPSSLENIWEDEGRLFRFPRDVEDKIVYCNLEGITWLDTHTLAVVSDKAKPGKQSKRCKQKDQSVHVFKLVEIA